MSRDELADGLSTEPDGRRLKLREGDRRLVVDPSPLLSRCLGPRFDGDKTGSKHRLMELLEPVHTKIITMNGVRR